MDYVKIIELFATISTLTGVTLVCIPKRIGIYFLIFGASLWIYFSFITDCHFLLVQSFYVLSFNVYAIFSWKKKGIK